MKRTLINLIRKRQERRFLKFVERRREYTLCQHRGFRDWSSDMVSKYGTDKNKWPYDPSIPSSQKRCTAPVPHYHDRWYESKCWRRLFCKWRYDHAGECKTWL